MLWNIENGKTNGITNWSKFCERFNSKKLEIITQLDWIHILYSKLACINPSDGFQTLTTDGLKTRIFSSNLLLVSQELFSNNYEKVSGVDISVTFKNL